MPNTSQAAQAGDQGHRQALDPTGLDYTHIASGEKRDQATAARLKRMGVTPGFPDLAFFGPHGEVCFIELKAGRGRLSESQQAIKVHLEQADHGYHCSSDYRAVIETLKGWACCAQEFMCNECGSKRTTPHQPALFVIQHS